MGFALEGDENELQGQAEADGEQIDVEILALEDDVEIEGQDIDQGNAGVGRQGVDIQEKIMVAPAPEDKITVNGAELTALSTLALLRQALTFYGHSTSGGKVKCFNKLINHQKKMELEAVHSAARRAEGMMQRDAQAPPLAELPSQKDQDKHHTCSL